MISSEERTVASDPSELLVKSVGAALRRLREDEQMSQKTFSARLQSAGWRGGSSLQTVSAWERGDTALPLSALPAIAEVFRIETSTLTRRLGLCGDPIGREIRIADAAEFVNELADEAPETAETIMRWGREMMAMARSGRLGRTN